MNQKNAAVLRAYLCDGWSHRRIQEEILGIEAPLRGGGYETMKILHDYSTRCTRRASTACSRRAHSSIRLLSLRDGRFG
jgi:hypothetical protein